MAAEADVPNVAHSNPVTQAGFTMIPNTVMMRADLSPGAKLVYGYLKHLAWRNGTDGVDPSRQTISRDLCVGEKAVTGYVKELRDAPVEEGDASEDAERLVVAVRRGQGRTNAYMINDPRSASSEARKVEPAFLAGSLGADPARARHGGPQDKGLQSGATAPDDARAEERHPDRPPALLKISGRNLALDTLADVCGIVEGSPRYIQAVVALNGRLDKRGSLKEPGIRHLFWRELLKWAESTGNEDRLSELDEDPERFERALERGIFRKAELYRARMPGATLTPKALRDWWLDLERQPARRDGGLTPDEIEKFTEAHG
jgi:hypothetical protein